MRSTIVLTTGAPLLLALAAGLACDKPPPEETNPPLGSEQPPAEEAPPAEAPAGPTEEEKAAAEAEKLAAEMQARADEQIAKGKELYGAKCASCHGAGGEGGKKAPKVVGEGALPEKPPKGAKMRKSDFHTAADIAAFVVASMPPKKGGSLSNEEYYAILAFDLSANNVAVKEPVTADNAASIVLHAPAAAGAAPAEKPAGGG